MIPLVCPWSSKTGACVLRKSHNCRRGFMSSPLPATIWVAIVGLHWRALIRNRREASEKAGKAGFCFRVSKIATFPPVPTVAKICEALAAGFQCTMGETSPPTLLAGVKE